jgi:hypothetical protein
MSRVDNARRRSSWFGDLGRYQVHVVHDVLAASASTATSRKRRQPIHGSRSGCGCRESRVEIERQLHVLVEKRDAVRQLFWRVVFKVGAKRFVPPRQHLPTFSGCRRSRCDSGRADTVEGSGHFSMNPAVLALASLFFVQAQIPEPATLAKEVEAHQRRMDELRENYTFHEITLTDELDRSGTVKATDSEERDVFFVNGYRIARLTKKNGKELSEGDRKSEQDRVNRLIEKDMNAAPGHFYNRRGENVGVSQILPLMKISSPRRTSLNGRSTLTFDFVGDPHLKAHGLAEGAARKIAGTVWIDEADRDVARLEARFDDDFHIGGGFLASIHKGTSLVFEQSRLGQGLWMPTVSEIHLAARELLVKGVRQNIHVKDSDFRRFEIGVQQQIAPPPQ